LAKTPKPAPPDTEAQAAEAPAAMTAAEAAAAMTAAEAAGRVQRVVDVREGALLVRKELPVEPDEVLAFRDYGTHVVVVTTDGRKLSSAPDEA
jgi:hypothetical protein